MYINLEFKKTVHEFLSVRLMSGLDGNTKETTFNIIQEK